MIHTLRLILWPSLLTLAVSVLRLTAEVQGWVTSQSGGRGTWLGISWLAFACGIWFALRLRRQGSGPRVHPAWPWTTLAIAILIAAVLWQFAPLIDGEGGEAGMAQLRGSVQWLVLLAIAMAAAQFLVWPRLAFTLLCYAVPARATVVAITWLAKSEGWDTHYTKFGPQGIERGMAETMVGATSAQIGFWVPFTVLAGMFAGAWFARRPQPR